MATGIPKKLRSANGGVSELQLTYSGKRSVADIMARKPVLMERAWTGPQASTGRLYFADNTHALATLMDDEAVRGKVRLIYIDPPFATQTAFHSRKLHHAYEDLLSGVDYVESLRERLVLLHRLLADDGSLYLHLDAKMVFVMKIILDEIFGPAGFRTCISRKKCNPKNYTRKQYGNIADFILFYSKSDAWIWNRPVEEWTPERTKEYSYVDASGRRFMKVPVHAPGIRHGETGGPWRGKLPPPGKHWQYPPRILDEMNARGEIFWSANGNPRRKIYLDNSPGVGVQDIWLDFRDAHNQNICITGYPTEKNPMLLKRIIEASSNPGDLVLDCYAGSGTTLAMADELGRRWIGVDNSAEAFRTILKRFAIGTEPMGDFVGGKQSPVREADLLTPLNEMVAECSNGKHRPILNFDLFIEAGLTEQAVPIITNWQKETGDSELAAKTSHRKAIRESGVRVQALA